MNELKFVDFGEVLRVLKQNRVQQDLTFVAVRKGWNSHKQFVSLCVPESDSVQEFLYIKVLKGKIVPWLASQTDMLAEDWVILEMKDIDNVVRILG